MRPKTSHVLEKNSNVFGKISHVFQETSDVFLLSLEEIKRKLRCLSSTPRKQESKVVNQQILKWCSHARTPTHITAIFVFLLSQPSQKSLQLSLFQFIARTFRTYFNTSWKTLRFFLLISAPYSIANSSFFRQKCPQNSPWCEGCESKKCKIPGMRARICAHARQPPLVCALIKPSCLRILKQSQNPAVKAEI